MHLEGFVDVVIDPPNVQGDIVLRLFGRIFILRFVKLQLIDFLRRD
jgi:hypothetical protein